jgi:hypothetical protein
MSPTMPPGTLANYARYSVFGRRVGIGRHVALGVVVISDGVFCVHWRRLKNDQTISAYLS